MADFHDAAGEVRAVELLSDDTYLCQVLRDGHYLEAKGFIRALVNDNSALRARVKKLTAALERIADADHGDGTEWFHVVADAALAECKEG